jgi:predicted enzyme related to lactoylglutathione lyase
VSDIKAALSYAVTLGATIKRPIGDMPEHGIKFAFVTDLEGHLIELVEML